MYNLNPTLIKPGEIKKMPERVSIMGGACFEVPNSDNGILLVVDAVEGGDVTVYAGDSVLAGDAINFYAYTGMNVIYLESGRHLNTTGDKKGKIYLNSDNAEHYGYVIELD